LIMILIYNSLEILNNLEPNFAYFRGSIFKNGSSVEQ